MNEIVHEGEQQVDPAVPSTLITELDRFVHFDERGATVVRVSTAGRLPVVMWNLLPGQANETHVHATTEHVQLVLRGELAFALGDAPPRIVRTGEAVVVPAGVVHGVRNDSSEPACYLAVSSPGQYEKVAVTVSR